MGVAVLGLAFACYTIGFNVIFGSTGQLFLCVAPRWHRRLGATIPLTTWGCLSW
jgi:hypothetical protein